MSILFSNTKLTTAFVAVLPIAPTAVYFQQQKSRMTHTLSQLNDRNAGVVAGLQGIPVAVFVGGTSGIGQGMVEAFGKWRDGRPVHIVIVGRNEAAAKNIFQRLPSPSPNSQATHEFVQCDATLMRNVETASRQILDKHPKINFLVMSPGFFTTGGRDETDEGIDKVLALHYYARWKFIDGLLPALTRAVESNEDAKVLSVLAAGRGGKIDLDDLGLKKAYSWKIAAEGATTYTDLMIESFAEQNPGITFAHSHPGLVRTTIIALAHKWWICALAPIVDLLFAIPFGVSQDECATYMWDGLLNKASDRGGALRVGRKGELLDKESGYFVSEEARRRLWKHTVEVMKV